MITTVIHEENKLQEILDLYRYLHPKDPELKISVQIENLWKRMLENPHLFYIGTEVDGILVGTCNIAIVHNLTRGARPYGVIENLVVHPDHRRKGIGTQLLKFAISIAWKRHCYKVMLLTSRQDDAILQFYEKAGFERGLKTGFVKYDL